MVLQQHQHMEDRFRLRRVVLIGKRILFFFLFRAFFFVDYYFSRRWQPASACGQECCFWAVFKLGSVSFCSFHQIGCSSQTAWSSGIVFLAVFIFWKSQNCFFRADADHRWRNYFHGRLVFIFLFSVCITLFRRYPGLGNLPLTSGPGQVAFVCGLFLTKINLEFQLCNPGMRFDFQLINVPDYQGVGMSVVFGFYFFLPLFVF